MIKLLELKRAIVEKRQLIRGHMDFDLQISNVQTGEEYKDDDMMINKNTTVMVRRVPATSKGGGLLSRLEGGNHNKRGNIGGGRGPKPIEVSGQRLEPPTDPRRRQQAVIQTDDATAAALQGAREALEEFKPKGNEQRGRANQQQAQPPPQRGAMMSGGIPNIPMHQPQQQYPRGATPGANYTCHRCGKQGHFIRDCPEKNNLNIDQNARQNEQRFRQGVAGVPRTFWKEVPIENEAQGGEAKIVGIAPARDRFETLVRRGVVQGIDMDPAKVREIASAEAPPHFRCSICSRIFEDAVLTPCCGETACDQCIRDSLVHSGGTCPMCTQPLQAERLVPNKQLRAAVDTFLGKWTDEQKRRDAHALAEEQQQAAIDVISGHLVAGQQKPDAILDLGSSTNNHTPTPPIQQQLNEQELYTENYSQHQEQYPQQEEHNNHHEDEFGGDVFAPRHHKQSIPQQQIPVPPVPMPPPVPMGADEMNAAAALADTKIPLEKQYDDRLPDNMYPPQPGDQPTLQPPQFHQVAPISAPPQHPLPMQQQHHLHQQEFVHHQLPMHGGFPPPPPQPHAGGMMPQFAQPMPPFGYPPMAGPPQPHWQQPLPHMQHIPMQPPPMHMQQPGWIPRGPMPGPRGDSFRPPPLPARDRLLSFEDFCELAREERRRFGRRRHSRGSQQYDDNSSRRQRRGDDDHRYSKKRSPSPSRRSSRRRDRSRSHSDDERPERSRRRSQEDEEQPRLLSKREKRVEEVDVGENVVFGAHMATPPREENESTDDLNLPPQAENHQRSNNNSDSKVEVD